MANHLARALRACAALGALALAALPSASLAVTYATFRLSDIELHGPALGASPMLVNGNWTLNSLTKNSAGGDAYATFHITAGMTGGPNPQSCAGRHQDVHFRWRFNRDATLMASGQPLAITLSMQSDTGACMAADPNMYTAPQSRFSQLPNLDEAQNHYFFQPPANFANVQTRQILAPANFTNPGGFSVYLVGGNGNSVGELAVRVDYNYLFAPGAQSPNPPGPPPPAAPPRAPTPVTLGPVTTQAQRRGPNGQVTVESAYIRAFSCNGRAYDLFQYTDRAPGQPAFRAVQPPNWGAAIGGRDFATQSQALAAACG